MTPEERRIAYAVVRWIALKTQFESRYDPLKGPTMADIDHSALLSRLLEGKEPLPVPPPKQFSYPAYHLVEADEPQYVLEVWFKDDGREVVIEQSPWIIVSKTNDEDYLVRWDHNQLYRLYKKDNVKVGFGWKHGQDMHDLAPKDIFERAWVLEKKVY